VDWFCLVRIDNEREILVTGLCNGLIAASWSAAGVRRAARTARRRPGCTEKPNGALPLWKGPVPLLCHSRPAL